MNQSALQIPSNATGPAASRRGIALIIGLVILAVLSMIGVAAFSITTQEERMAGNARDRMRAFEAAEAGVPVF
jgi:type IV pilus assembly protein PilX